MLTFSSSITTPKVNILPNVSTTPEEDHFLWATCQVCKDQIWTTHSQMATLLFKNRFKKQKEKDGNLQIHYHLLFFRHFKSKQNKKLQESTKITVFIQYPF